MKSKPPRIEVLPIESAAVPDPGNVNKHTERGGALLENSLRKRGAFRSVASAGKGTKRPTLYAGSRTYETAIAAGYTEVINVHTDGHQLVNVVRDDIKPGSPEAIALGIEDNEIGRQSYNPDIDILAAITAGDNAILKSITDSDRIFNSICRDITVRAGGMFTLDEEEEKHSGTNPNVFSLTIPCSKKERDEIIKYLNEIKQENSFSTSTQALLFVLRNYADA